MGRCLNLVNNLTTFQLNQKVPVYSPFWVEWSLVMINGFSIIILTEKKRESIYEPEQLSKKVMLSVWLYMKDVVYHEMLNQNETVNTEYCCQYYTKICRKCPTLVNRKGVSFLHDKARVTHEQIIALNISCFILLTFFKWIETFFLKGETVCCEEVKTDIWVFFCIKTWRMLCLTANNFSNRLDYIINNECKYYLEDQRTIFSFQSSNATGLSNLIDICVLYIQK